MEVIKFYTEFCKNLTNVHKTTTLPGWCPLGSVEEGVGCRV